MNNDQVHRFLNKKLSREEIKELHEKVNRDEASVLRMMEEDWESYTYSGSWPDEHWEKIENQIKPTKEKKEPARVFRLHWFAKAAASLLMIVSAWFAYKSQETQVTVEGDSPEMITHSNNTDQPETVVLKDGTKVILAGNSSLSYYENFNDKYRVVHLNGEAYFETNKGNIRPFIVISENITSICRSHEFSVSAFQDSEEINIVSSSGQIEIAQNDRLNSEYNKVAVESCQRYSFNKSSQQYLIGRVADCEFDDKVRSMKNDASPEVIVML